MILIIMCDLKSFADVASLSEAVASLGPSIHFLNSFWLLSTDKSLGYVHNTLHTRRASTRRLHNRAYSQTTYNLPNEAFD